MNEANCFSEIRTPAGRPRSRAEMTNAPKSCGKLLNCAGMAMLLGATSAAAQSSRESWYFSAAEIGAAYQYQETYGGRMRNPLPAFGCMTGKAVFAATYRGVPVQVSCPFVNEVTRHLKDMFDIGAARYLFPLDADHAHLAVPAACLGREIQQAFVSAIDGSAPARAQARGTVPHSRAPSSLRRRQMGPTMPESGAGGSSATCLASSTVGRCKFCRPTPKASAWAYPMDWFPTAVSIFSPANAVN